MKKFFTNISNKYEERIELPIISRFELFIEKLPEISCLLLLGILCYLVLFVGLDFYPLLDVDETRYAVMSRDLAHSFDWNLLKLNGVPFLEKPPLYFWLTGLSVELFGQFNQFIVRLPMAILSTFIVFFTYLTGKIVISRKFGMYSALILLSSVFFLMLSHIAILDMVLTVFVTSAIYCGFLTNFCPEKYKKYFWWYFYLFIGMGFMAKGLLAFILPVAVIGLYNLFTKNLKEIFKPINILPGILIMLFITLPWHLYMYMIYGNHFIHEYFLLHHFARFVNSAEIGRNRPLLYFVPIFIVGFLPWALSFIAFSFEALRKLVSQFIKTEGSTKLKWCETFAINTNEDKVALFSSVYFLLMFLFFSISSTKLPTYILPLFPAAALLTGYFWYRCENKRENFNIISVSTQIFASLLVISAVSCIFLYYLLPVDFQFKIAVYKSHVIIGLILLGILLFLRLDTKKVESIFGGYVLTMLFVIIVAVSFVFNIIFNSGENELVEYSKLAYENKAELITFDFAVKPSTMIEYQNQISFITDTDFDMLSEKLKDNSSQYFINIKNKNLNEENYKKNISKILKLVKYGEK